MKKIFEEGIIISIIMVALISIVQILLFGSEKYSMAWHDNMFKTGIILCLIFPLIYYFTMHKDISETLGLFLTSIILWFTGFADLLYFVFQWKLPYTLPWMNDHLVIGKIRELLGLTVVTNTLLLVSVGIGFVIVLTLDIWLEKIN